MDERQNGTDWHRVDRISTESSWNRLSSTNNYLPYMCILSRITSTGCLTFLVRWRVRDNRSSFCLKITRTHTCVYGVSTLVFPYAPGGQKSKRYRNVNGPCSKCDRIVIELRSNYGRIETKQQGVARIETYRKKTYIYMCLVSAFEIDNMPVSLP